jgi:hypothetical protein
MVTDEATLNARLREWRRLPHNDRDAAIVALALAVRRLSEPGDTDRLLADAILREERLLPAL